MLSVDVMIFDGDVDVSLSTSLWINIAAASRLSSLRRRPLHVRPSGLSPMRFPVCYDSEVCSTNTLVVGQGSVSVYKHEVVVILIV